MDLFAKSFCGGHNIIRDKPAVVRGQVNDGIGPKANSSVIQIYMITKGAGIGPTYAVGMPEPSSGMFMIRPENYRYQFPLFSLESLL